MKEQKMKEQKIDNSRRSFIKRSAAGFAGAALLPSLLDAEQKETKKNGQPGHRVRVLGRTGIKVPVISVGGRSAEPNLYKAALDAGLTYFDTANTYHNGNHETMLGKVFKGKPRDSFIVSTKVHVPVEAKTGLMKISVSAAVFLDKFETSLKRLGLDHVDILFMHGIARGETAVHEVILSAMQKLKKQGKARFIGVSTHANEPEVIRAAAKSGVYDVVMTSYNFRQPHLKEVEAAIDLAAGAGLGIVAMKTLAGTYWDRERKHPINLKAALKWVLQNKNIHTTLPGFTTFQHLEEDVAIMKDMRLTPRERIDLKLDQKLSFAGLYCAQCRQCLGQCQADLDIPTLMRSYMYVYGHKDPVKAKSTLEKIDFSGLSCESCTACTVKCTMGFRVKERVLDITRLSEVPREFLV